MTSWRKVVKMMGWHLGYFRSCPGHFILLECRTRGSQRKLLPCAVLPLQGLLQVLDDALALRCAQPWRLLLQPALCLLCMPQLPSQSLHNPQLPSELHPLQHMPTQILTPPQHQSRANRSPRPTLGVL